MYHNEAGGMGERVCVCNLHGNREMAAMHIYICCAWLGPRCVCSILHPERTHLRSKWERGYMYAYYIYPPQTQKAVTYIHTSAANGWWPFSPFASHTRSWPPRPSVATGGRHA